MPWFGAARLGDPGPSRRLGRVSSLRSSISSVSARSLFIVCRDGHGIPSVHQGSRRHRFVAAPVCTSDIWMAVLPAPPPSKRSRADRWRSGPAPHRQHSWPQRAAWRNRPPTSTDRSRSPAGFIERDLRFQEPCPLARQHHSRIMHSPPPRVGRHHGVVIVCSVGTKALPQRPWVPAVAALIVDVGARCRRPERAGLRHQLLRATTSLMRSGRSIPHRHIHLSTASRQEHVS